MVVSQLQVPSFRLYWVQFFDKLMKEHMESLFKCFRKDVWPGNRNDWVFVGRHCVLRFSLRRIFNDHTKIDEA